MIYLVSVGFVFALIWSLTQPSRVERCVQKSVKNSSIVPIIEELQNRPPTLQPRFFTQSMEILWRLETSPQTTEVIQKLTLFFVQQNPQLSIGHRWIFRIQQERPHIITPQLLQNYDCSYINKKEAG